MGRTRNQKHKSSESFPTSKMVVEALCTTEKTWAKTTQSVCYRSHLPLPTTGSTIKMASPFCGGILKLSQLFQDFTITKVGNGRKTSFWYDVWVLDSPLCKVLPDLPCFANNPLESIAGFFAHNNLQSNFNTPLSYAATEGYIKLIN